jgi:hypothetical protein
MENKSLEDTLVNNSVRESTMVEEDSANEMINTRPSQSVTDQKQRNLILVALLVCNFAA